MSSNKFSLRSAVRPSRTRMLPIPDASVVLKKYGTNAHLWLPGVGYMNGEQAGNYIDSAGTQAGLVDNPVGFVLDATASTKIPAVSDFGVPSTYDNTLTAVTSSGFSANAGTTNTRAYINLQTVIGKTYRLQANLSSFSGNITLFARDNLNGVGTILATSVAFTSGQSAFIEFIATTTASSFMFTSGSLAISYSVSNIKIYEAINATQGTTANKPILRRGAVNIRPYSDAILVSNSYSVANATLATATAATPTGSPTASLLTLNVGANTGNSADGFNFGAGITLTNSTQYTQSLFVKPAGRTILRLRSNVGGAVFDFTLIGNGTAPTPSGDLQAASIVPFANGWYRVSWVFTSTTAVPGNRFDYWAIKTDVADGINGVYVAGAQLELGSTASEYIPTTTAAASSSSRNYYWQFDGSNDSLALSSVPFQMADDFAIVIGMRGLPLLPTDAFCVASTSNANALIKLGLSATAVAQFRCQDDAGTADNMLSVSTYTQALVVLAGKKNGNAKTLRVNGVATSSSSTALGTTTLTNAGIGYRPLATPINYMTGSIYPVIAIKGTVSDADLLVLERWVGSLSGVSI